MKNDKNVKFIRKNGKVIPVKSDGKGPNNLQKAAKKVAFNKELSRQASQRIKKSEKRATKFAIGGGIAGLALGRMTKLGGLTGAMLGTIGGAVLSGEAKKQRKLKEIRDNADTKLIAWKNGSSV
jgi:hypothetical protein